MSDNIERLNDQKNLTGVEAAGISGTSVDRNCTKISYCGFWRRVIATIIDLYIGLGVLGLIYLAPQIANSGASISIPYFYWAAFLLTLWIYFTIMESSPVRATLGKLTMAVFVTDNNNQRINFARANARFWSKLISLIMLCIGFMIAGSTKKKQALHDIIAGTLVLRKKGGLEFTEKDQKTAKLIRQNCKLGPLLMTAGILAPFMLPVVGYLVHSVFKISGDSISFFGIFVGALAAVPLHCLAIAKAGKIIRIAAISLLVLSLLWLPFAGFMAWYILLGGS